MTLALAKKGISTIFTYNSHPEEPPAVIKEVESYGTGAKAAAIQLNVTEFAKYDAFVEKFKAQLKEWGVDKFDIFIPGAGIGPITPLFKTEESTLDSLFQIHFKAPFMLSQRVVPLLREKTSVIITISTGLSRFTLGPMGAYAAMKGGVEVWTKYLAAELGPKGIRCITARVGAIESDFGGGAVRDNKEMNDHIAQNTALGRVGLPNDIGSAIANIVDLGWCTGTVIEISGGQQL